MRVALVRVGLVRVALAAAEVARAAVCAGDASEATTGVSATDGPAEATGTGPGAESSADVAPGEGVTLRGLLMSQVLLTNDTNSDETFCK